MAVRFVFDDVRRRLGERQAIALLGRLEQRADSSDVALRLARSLARAVASGSATDLVLDEEDRAELLGTLEDWRSEGEFADEPRWLYMALVGERLPWEVWPGSGP